MKLDIQTGVQTAFITFLLLALLSFIMGISSIRAGTKLQYFRKRHDRVMQGWRMLFVSFAFGIASFVVNSYAEPVVYRIYPPSPTVTLTSTITITPTISLTPTITETPTITNTPSITNTPGIPEEVASQFESTITPAAEPVFSSLRFARKLDKNYQPEEPAEEFANPISSIFASFSYDQMTPNAQWSALWYRNGELVWFETIPWNGGTGGFGYSEWAPTPDQWLPGIYEVQMFVGTKFIVSGQFTVTGTPPTAAPTKPPTPTRTATPTIGPSPTRTDTPTPTVTITPTITKTPTITLTRRPTATRWPTLTPAPPHK